MKHPGVADMSLRLVGYQLLCKRIRPLHCRTKGRLVVPPAFLLYSTLTGASRLSYSSSWVLVGTTSVVTTSVPASNSCESNCPWDELAIHPANTGVDFTALPPALHHPAGLCSGRRVLVSGCVCCRDYTKIITASLRRRLAVMGGSLHMRGIAREAHAVRGHHFHGFFAERPVKELQLVLRGFVGCHHDGIIRD